MKKITSFSAVALLLITIIIQSCTLVRFAYSPTIQNVPAFTEKNESRVTAFFAGPISGSENDVAFQGAYAVSDHFALTAGVNNTAKSQDEIIYTDGSGVSQTDVVKYKRNSVDLGAGIFYPVSKDNKVFIEAYAGYGFGSNKISDLTNNILNDFHNSDVNRFYLQPVLSIHPSEITAVSISLRYTSIGYTNIKTSYSPDELSSYSLTAIASKRISFIEPAFIFSLGIRNAPWIRLQGQMNFSLLMGNSEVNYRSNYFGMGLQFDPVKAFRSSKD